MHGHGHGASSRASRRVGTTSTSTGAATSDDDATRPLLDAALASPALRAALDEDLLPALRRTRVALLAAAATDVAGPLVALRGIPAEPAGYDVARAKEDVAIAALVAGSLAALAAAVAVRRSPLPLVAYYVELVRVVLTLGKCVAFSWTTASHESVVLLVAGAALALVSLALLSRLDEDARVADDALEFLESEGARGAAPPSLAAKDADAPPPELSLWGLAAVMRPYFLPKGAANKLRCVATWGFLVASKTSNLCAPIFIGRAVQHLADGSSLRDDVYPNVATYAALLLSAKLCTELQNVAYLGVKQNAFAEIAERSFAHLHTLSLEWHLKKKMGQTLRSLDRGISAADTVVTYLFLYLVPSAVELGVTMLVVAHHFHVPAISATLFSSFALYSIATVRMALWRKSFRESVNKSDNDFHDRATESLVNFETVKVFTAEDFETQRYTAAVRKYQQYSIMVQLSLSLLNGTQQLVIQACQLTALCIAAHEVHQGRLELGAFVSVQSYVMQLFAPLGFLGTIWNALVQARVDMRNLSQLLAEQADVRDDPSAPEMELDPRVGWEIRFENVSFRYPTQALGAGLKDVSITVPHGTETALCGHTGSGKSTIARLLFRFYDVDRGAVLLSGRDVRRVQQRSLRGVIGVVPQDTVLFNESLLYNVLYGRRDATQAEIEDACARAQILDTIRALPEGFNTVVGERGLKLSGGEKQRVAVARAFLKNAPVLVLDEWSAALDTRTEKQIHASISQLAKERTTLVIAHRLVTVARAQQICVLHEGVVVERGTHDELLAAVPRSRYAEMWFAQVEETAAVAAPVVVPSPAQSPAA